MLDDRCYITPTPTPTDSIKLANSWIICLNFKYKMCIVCIFNLVVHPLSASMVFIALSYWPSRQVGVGTYNYGTWHQSILWSNSFWWLVGGGYGRSCKIWETVHVNLELEVRSFGLTSRSSSCLDRVHWKWLHFSGNSGAGKRVALRQPQHQSYCTITLLWTTSTRWASWMVDHQYPFHVLKNRFSIQFPRQMRLYTTC